MESTDKITVDELSDWLHSLNDEEKRGAIDAINDILNSRGKGPLPPMPPPEEIEVDPDLEKPDIEDDNDYVDDYDIDDPDQLLDKNPKEDSKKRDQLADLRDILDKLNSAKDEQSDDSESDGSSTTDIEKSISEISKAIEELESSDEALDDKQVNEMINRALDALQKAGKLEGERISGEEVDSQIKNMTDEMPSLEDEIHNEDQDNRYLDKDFVKRMTSEAEKERLKKELDSASGGSLRSIEEFKTDLLKTIGTEVGRYKREITKVKTYMVPNRLHEPDDVAIPGERSDTKRVRKKDKPSIDVYIDQSGSWTDYDVRVAMDAIKDLLDFEKEELLTISVWYYSEVLTQDKTYARSRCGRECWDYVINNINAEPKTKNVIIFADSDIKYNYREPGCHGCVDGPGTEVDGYVWFIWKNSDFVKQACKKLSGKKGVSNYTFS